MSAQETQNQQTLHWNGRAGHAWVDAQPFLDAMFKPFEDMLVDAVVAGARKSVLDVGCGTGGVALAIARRLGPAGRAVGVDISEPMLALARARAEQEGVSATFIAADAQTYPFEPASFDMIISRFGVMFFDDPAQAFANLRRSTAEGGDLRIIAWRNAAENPFMTTAERAAAPFLPNPPVRQPNAPGQFAFADEARVRGILDQNGWARIDIRPIDVPCAFPAAELVNYFTRLGPLALVLPEVDERTRAQIIDAARAAFEPFVHGAEVRFTAACWMIGASTR